MKSAAKVNLLNVTIREFKTMFASIHSPCNDTISVIDVTEAQY